MKVELATDNVIDTFLPLDNNVSTEYIKSEIAKGSDGYVFDDDGKRAVLLMRAKSDDELEVYCFVNVDGKSLNLTSKAISIVEEIAIQKGFSIVMFSTKRTGLIQLATQKYGYTVEEVILKKVIDGF